MTEIEQRYLITFLHAKTLGLGQIVAELASVYGEQADAKKARIQWSIESTNPSWGDPIWRTK
jgi:hypothetical protein